MFDELEQMQEVAAENFKRECFLLHENTNTRFDEHKFSGLLKEIDSDWRLNSCLVIAYSQAKAPQRSLTNE